MDAIVLVGGLGTRLRPLTLTRHKSLVPVLGRAAIEYLFDWLERAGFERAVLAVGRFNDDLADAYAGGRPGKLTVEVIREQERLESGGAIRYAVETANVQGRFAVLNGDVFVDFDFRAALAQHEARGADLTLALYEVPNPSQYGVAVLDDDDMVIGFVEKPPAGTEASKLVNAGVWIFEPGLVAQIPPGPVRVEETLFPSLVGRGRPVLGYTFSGVWADIGTPARYLELTQTLLARDGLAYFGPGAVVDARSQVSASSLGDRTTIEPDAIVTESVLWEDIRVGAGARISRSILADGVQVGAGAVLDGAVVGAGAIIPTGLNVKPGTLIEPHSTAGAS
ncbi:MAG: sugar phosphate nucleotidyltransferase [Dehalococcoidia bacterium]